ncbi:MAG: hypothetical protein ACKVT2_09945 [Saprospiraceae bacterium]
MCKIYGLLLSFFFCTLTPLLINAQWTKTNGLLGGHTSRLLNYGDTVLANAGNDLYFSSNHGENWSPIVNPSYSDINVLSIEAQNVIGYAYNLIEQKFIWFRSNDFFQTLHPIFVPDTIDFYQPFLAFGYLYVTDYSGFYRTNDDGENWEKVSPVTPTETQIVGQQIIGIDYTYLVQSNDKGFTWDTLLHYSGQLDKVLQHGNHIFVFIFSPSDGCYSSDNYGQTWQYYPNAALDKFHNFIWHNEQIYGLDADKLIKSSDYGLSWENVTLPQDSKYPAILGVSLGNTLIIGGYLSVGAAGMHRSTDDGNTWIPTSVDITTGSGKLRKIGQNLLVPSFGGLFQIEPDDVNWIKLTLNLPQPLNSYLGFTDFVKTGNNWLISDGRAPWVSVDGGVSWVKSDLPPQPSWNKINIYGFELAGNKVVGWGPGTEFFQYFISDDNGLSFEEIQSLDMQFPTQRKCIDVDQGKVYAIASNKKIYRSDDGCDTWMLQAGQIPIDSLGLGEISEAQLLVRGNVMFIMPYCSEKIMLYSKDAGQTWTVINLVTAGLPFGEVFFNDLLYIGSNLVAATYNGIFFSQNDGTDWIDWNDGLANHHVFDLEIHDDYLWVATQGSGIWKRPLTQLGTSPTLDQGFLNSPFQLSPNPASQFVHIQIGDESGELSIFDAMGRVVLRQSVEKSNLVFSVQNLPVGHYKVLFIGEKAIRHALLEVQR